jgi:hypothetical protein
MTEPKKSIIFSFYDFGIEVASSDPQTIDNISRDFSFFVSPEKVPEIHFEIFAAPFNYQNLPTLRPLSHSPRNFSYQNGNLLFIDYFGRGLLIFDRIRKEYRIFSADPQLRHEIVFLAILSLIGQNFDLKHIHRVHGLGLEINGKGTLILLPQGGGKTTLMLELLKYPNVKLISEDTPLINPSGEILPFPIRIGIDAEAKLSGLPEKHLRLIERMEFKPKYLLDIDYFKDKIAKKPCKLEFVFEGIRCLGNGSQIIPASKLKLLRAFLINSVIGLGVYQGIEFLIQSNPLELIKKSALLASRMRNSCQAVLQAKTYAFLTGSDKNKNTETFINFFGQKPPQDQ